MRQFEVTADAPHSWPGMSPAAQVVTEFLARVRLTGDPEAATALLAPTGRAHQVVAETPTTI